MEYYHYFTKRTWFYEYIAFNEYQRACHFEKGLHPSIRKFVSILILLTYDKIFNQDLMVKKLDNNNK